MAAMNPLDDAPVRQTAPPRRHPHLARWIALGLFAGIACGLFFGDYCAPLKFAGDAFVGLLQMTVLPYISLALISNIGRLSRREGKRLAATGFAVLGILWAIGLIVIVLIAASFPRWKTASFFSAHLVESPDSIDFLGLFIPANVFWSLAQNLVPAVVLFCIFLGAAIVGMDRKQSALSLMDFLTAALARVNGFIVRLTPLGVFAIGASTAGTMTIDELGRLQAYLISYTAAVVLLTFWVLPALVAACTPFGYRDILRASRDALMTALATGKLLVVLPMLIEDIEAMFTEYGYRNDETHSTVNVAVPLAYSFPHLGKLLGLLFIPFAAWFVGESMSPADYPSFLVAGVLSYFGGPIVATPFLLDMQGLPADMFQLFLATGVYAGRISDMLGAMHLCAFTVVTSCVLGGLLRIKRGPLLRAAVVSILLLAVVVGGTRSYLSWATSGEYDKDKLVEDMHLLLNTAPAVVHKTIPPLPPESDEHQSILERIRAAGVLRVGFLDDSLPFSFFNNLGELVGLDVDMAHLLATEMGCRIEFIPVELGKLAEMLDAGQVDIVMSGLAITTDRLEQMRFTRPYMNVNIAFVVEDRRRSDFLTRDRLQAADGLRIAVPRSTYFRDKLQAYLPKAEIVQVESPLEFFENPQEHLNAMLFSAEAGSAWTLLYPDFHVAVPGPGVISMPLAYPIGRRDEEFANFVSQWINLKKQSGNFDTIYNHWILGQGAQPQKPRWSILRDVLHWVD